MKEYQMMAVDILKHLLFKSHLLQSAQKTQIQLIIEASIKAQNPRNVKGEREEKQFGCTRKPELRITTDSTKKLSLTSLIVKPYIYKYIYIYVAQVSDYTKKNYTSQKNFFPALNSKKTRYTDKSSYFTVIFLRFFDMNYFKNLS